MQESMSAIIFLTNAVFHFRPCSIQGHFSIYLNELLKFMHTDVSNEKSKIVFFLYALFFAKKVSYLIKS